MIRRDLSALIYVLVLQLAVQSHQTLAFGDSTHYDPEILDGIPVINAKGTSPAIKWDYERRHEEGSPRTHRRSSDNELDDGIEDDDDEDRDEYKSGSSNHDSYENPSFGESRRAAKDGDEIESFFDKHIGPQDIHESSGEDREVPISDIHRQVDSDDRYEAAASSPLVSIFQSILNHAHNKRPLVITTSDDQSSSNSASTTDDSQQATSSSAPVGSSMRGSNGDYAGPTGLYRPIASPATMAGYDQLQDQTGAQNQDDYSPVRTIYIARRPVMQQYASMSGQSSNANWRGSRPSGRYYQQQEQADYSRYPVAASYAYNKEQAGPQQPEDDQTVSYNLSFGGSAADEPENSPEEQTNTYEEQEYPLYNTRSNLRHSSSSRSYDNYNYAPMAQVPPGYVRVSQEQLQQPEQQPQSHYQGARYHRDPSESVQSLGYSQYRGSTTRGPKQVIRDDLATRQKLLNQLNQQIQSNPNYQGGYAAAATSDHTFRGGKRLPQMMVSAREPVTDATIQSGLSSPRVASSVAENGSHRLPQYATNGSLEADGGSRNNNVQVGPITNVDGQTQSTLTGDILRQKPEDQNVRSRVRRDDSDDRDSEDPDDDGVWVDDDDDDDNRQQSSDVSETAQQPGDEEEDDTDDQPQDPNGVATQMNPPGVIGGPHGYELSPNDLMIYHGR